jgi:hypothetical protein
LDDFSNTGIHLSNYSLNKQYFGKSKAQESGKIGQSMVLNSSRSKLKTSVVGKLSQSGLQSNRSTKRSNKSTMSKTSAGKFKNVSKINKSESAIEDAEIKKMIQEQYSVNWDETIKPQIHKIVLKTIQSCNSKIKHRPRSFEIYGFDLMLDANLKPWLIEVNLSPACSQRTQFLKNMLSDMTEHLFRILRHKEMVGTHKFRQNVEEFKKYELEKKEK